MIICLEQGANDFYMVQLMSLPPHHLLLQLSPEWLPFWCQLTQVVVKKRPLNGCSSSSSMFRQNYFALQCKFLVKYLQTFR